MNWCHREPTLDEILSDSIVRADYRVKPVMLVASDDAGRKPKVMELAHEARRTASGSSSIRPYPSRGQNARSGANDRGLFARPTRGVDTAVGELQNCTLAALMVLRADIAMASHMRASKRALATGALAGRVRSGCSSAAPPTSSIRSPTSFGECTGAHISDYERGRQPERVCPMLGLTRISRDSVALG
jgi:hypothetical protein